MNQEAWLRFLDTLPVKLRDALQMTMQRIDFVILSYANRHNDDIQKLYRKVNALEHEIDELRLKSRAVGE